MTNQTFIMHCGHSNNAKTEDGFPACAICGCTKIASSQPNLTGRMAKCAECTNTTESSTSLPFFEHKPTQEHDRYYCGCWGWD